MLTKKKVFNHLVFRQLPFGGPSELEIKQNMKGLLIKINMRWKIEWSEPNISNLGFLTFGTK